MTEPWWWPAGIVVLAIAGFAGVELHEAPRRATHTAIANRPAPGLRVVGELRGLRANGTIPRIYYWAISCAAPHRLCRNVSARHQCCKSLPNMVAI
ncbi:MAG TPA: hypothetical protein VMU77_06740 [Acidimicrobiales bacterium]|nr:hypothetical protein [Acidimicrobiales bacterium]